MSLVLKSKSILQTIESGAFFSVIKGLITCEKPLNQIKYEDNHQITMNEIQDSNSNQIWL